MFQTLDLMISLGVVFLILSMVLKYLMTMIKRILKTKATVIAEEMKTFVGESTSKYLIPYLDKQARHLNFLEVIKKPKGNEGKEKGLRQLNKEQLREVVESLSEFLKNRPAKSIKSDLEIEMSVDEIKKTIKGIKVHLGRLKDKIEANYDNTMQKISERYESNLRWYTLIFGLIFAFFINADFFEMYSSLSRNSLARGRLVAQAEIISGQMQSLSSQIDLKGKEGIRDFETFGKDAEETVSKFTEELSRAELSLGWKWQHVDRVGLFFGRIFGESQETRKAKKENDKKERDKKEAGKLVFRDLCALIKKLVGIIISGLLISFGAPFWHDFLQSMTGINKILRKSTARKEGALTAEPGKSSSPRAGAWLPHGH